MRLLLGIGVFVASVMAGFVLSGFLPEGLLPKAWRLPIGAFLIGVGIALAVIAITTSPIGIFSHPGGGCPDSSALLIRSSFS